MRDRKSTNKSILRDLMSRSRRFKSPHNMDYILLYTFLYKYCSDTVKSYLEIALEDKELTIDEAYRDSSAYSQLSFDSLKLNGFFIKSSEAFIDEIVANNYMKPGFLPDFLKVFPENVIFSSEYHNPEYFNDLFLTIDNEIDTFQFDIDQTRNICEVIYLISKLDVFDSSFEFTDVFNIVSASKMMNIDSNPEFVMQILSKLVLSDRKTIGSAYDPFMKDGAALMKIQDAIGYDLKCCYGKDASKLNYLYTLVKFFINDFSFNNLFLRPEDGLDSIDFNGASFDIIVSRVPIAIKNYYSSNINQNMEISKRNRRSEIESLLLENLGMDGNSFKKDNELNRALENLVEKINLEGDFNENFTEQYASLKDSEFLFLLNLIDSLKDDGVMAISISENFLFKHSLETLRKYLTLEKNYIDAIIRIPTEIVRARPEVVIVFRKNRNMDDILFIDMSSDYDTQTSRLAYPGLFRKNLVLDGKTIDRMCDVYFRRVAIPKFSNVISMAEIMDNGFNLSVSRYVDTFEGEFISLDDLATEKQDIDSKIDELNKKIGKMMDELNIRF